MKKFLRYALPSVLLVPLLAAASFGGWAILTMEDLPEYLVAGQETTLDFTMRQHGVELMKDLAPRIEARSGSSVVSAKALPGKETGKYRAKITLPAAGDWSFSINTGFMNQTVKLMPLVAIAQGAKAPPAMALGERGKRLFVAKGCMTCHVHNAVDRQAAGDIGPNLTGRQYPADYLARFLADPSITPPRRGSMGMPNFNLKQPEIAALTAFINAEQHATR